jgi:hypothetical protein
MLDTDQQDVTIQMRDKSCLACFLSFLLTPRSFSHAINGDYSAANFLQVIIISISIITTHLYPIPTQASQF